MDSVADIGLAPSLLVVDDELVQRLIVSRMAGKMGYATCSVASLGEAAALLENREVDVIVLDLSLRDRERH